MKRLAIVLFIALPMTAFAWPWSQDMMNQPSIKPQEGTMAPFPRRSVPYSIPYGGELTQVATREEARDLVNPVAVSAKSLKKGKQLFKIYCGACHGLQGKADESSPIAAKIGAIPLIGDYVQKDMTEGWIWGTITYGSYVMPAYGSPTGNAEGRGSNDLTVEERWHVVNYLRNQLVADANGGTVATETAQASTDAAPAVN
ncbi:MAG: cytochrome c [Gammaproteobacteria bacterium]|nr:cytochrome c [Gammaproteobacteria bacterium]